MGRSKSYWWRDDGDVGAEPPAVSEGESLVVSFGGKAAES